MPYSPEEIKGFEKQLALLVRKRDFLQAERTKAVDANAKFAIDEEIAELNQQISGLKNRLGLPEPTAENDPSPEEVNEPLSKSPTPQAPSVKLPVLLGAACLAAAAIALFSTPCPSGPQETLFRTLTALGAGGIASALPGFFELKTATAKAGSALGVFLLVFSINPASNLAGNGCEQLAFGFTINLQHNSPVSSAYPPFTGGRLQLFVENDWRTEKIDENGLADFKSLPGELRDLPVPVRLRAKYWELTQDSIPLSGKSQALKIVPDNSLGTVKGQVLNTDGTQPLPGVVVSLFGRSDTTDAAGAFRLPVAPEQQQTAYTLAAAKPGYQPLRQRFSYSGNPLSLRLQEAE